LGLKLSSEPVFVNVKGAQESILPGWESIPALASFPILATSDGILVQYNVSLGAEERRRWKERGH
jgi:hypothetical protein